MANTLKSYLLRYLRELRNVPTDDLLEGRYQKFRRMGVFSEITPEQFDGIMRDGPCQSPASGEGT
jgi:hypothetical protein